MKSKIKICDKGAENLAIGIVKQLCKDYKNNFKRTLRECKTNIEFGSYGLAILDKDIHSDWICETLGLDVEYAAPRLRKECVQELICKGYMTAEQALQIIENLTQRGILKRYPMYL